MMPAAHSVASGLVSAGFWISTRSWAAVFVCFLCGVLMDLDHIIDYYLAKKRIPLSFNALRRYCSNEKKGKLYLIFHSYELVFLLWIAVVVNPINIVLWAFAVGMSVHMLMDNVHNPYRPFSLFFVYRLRHRFEKIYIYPKDFYKGLE